MKKTAMMFITSIIMITSFVYGDHKGEHPGKKSDPKKALKKIESYIQLDSKLKGGFYIQDKENKRLRELNLVKLHEIREVDGKWYNCADFADSNKDAVDLDFYLDSKGELSQILVHKVNGKVLYNPPLFPKETTAKTDSEM